MLKKISFYTFVFSLVVFCSIFFTKAEAQFGVTGCSPNTTTKETVDCNAGSSCFVSSNCSFTTGNGGAPGTGSIQCEMLKTTSFKEVTTTCDAQGNATYTSTPCSTPSTISCGVQITQTGCRSNSECPTAPDVICNTYCTGNSTTPGSCVQTDLTCGTGGGSYGVCGDGICGGGETNATCPADCPVSTPADFALSSNPTSVTIQPGGSASYTITASSVAGYNGHVNLDYTSCPTGATCRVTATTLRAPDYSENDLDLSYGSQTATLWVTNTTNIAIDDNSVTVHGVGGGKTHDIYPIVHVTPPVPSTFTETVSSASACPARYVTLSWSAVAGATNYRLFRNTTNSQPVTPYKTVGAVTSDTDSPATGATYYYWIEAATSPSTNHSASRASSPASVSVTDCPPVADMQGWGGSVSQSAPIHGTIPMALNSVGGLVWTSTGATSCHIYRGATDVGAFPVNGNAGVGPLDQSYTHSIVCTGPGGTSASNANTTVTHSVSAMSGTLTAATTSCAIPLGGSTCNVNLNWSVTNPESTPTAITAVGMTNINVTNTTATPQSGTQSVPVTWGGRTFYLYNNNKSLGQVAIANTSVTCASGSWNGTTCAMNNDSTCTSITASSNPVTAGEAFTETIVMRNAGTTTWIPTTANNYHLTVFPWPSATWSGARAPVSSSVAPGSSYTFNIPLIAPSTPGAYSFNTKMLQEGIEWFGATCAGSATNITVVARPTVTLSAPASANTNTPFTVSWSSANAVGVVVTSSDLAPAGCTMSAPAIASNELNSSRTITCTTTGAKSFQIAVVNSVGSPIVIGYANVNITSAPVTPIAITNLSAYFPSITNFPTTNNNSIYWTTTGSPDSCTTSGSAPWSSSAGQTAVSSALATGSYYAGVYPATGTYTYTLTCAKAGTASATSTISVVVSSPALPTVTTTSPVTNITSTTATGGGNITSNGGATVTVSGLAWSTSANPTTANSKTTDGWAIGGPWSSAMTGLTPNTLYHVRAYATNSAGTSYGADVTFTTGATPQASFTLNPTTMAFSGVVGGGAPTQQILQVVSNGTANVSYTITSSQPSWCLVNGGSTISGAVASSPTGQYSPVAITVPTPSTLGAGTWTCNMTVSDPSASPTSRVLVVTYTIAGLPTVTTNAVSSITSSTATGGGNITSNGGATVTVSGLAWSTSANPTTANSKTTDGWAIGGPWSSAMTGLTPNTLYHVRAYATNSAGTSYGADVTFTTTAATPIDITNLSAYFPSISNFPTTNNNSIYFTVTGNPDSCVPTGSTPWSSASGQSAVTTAISTASTADDNFYAGVYPAVGTYTYTLTCAKAGTASVARTISVVVSSTPVMTGALTPATTGCVVASGASTCTVNHTWSTTNPVAVSAVTSDLNNSGASSPNFTVVSGNSGGPTAFTVPYGGRTFYLYNNAQLLATSAVSAGSVTCASGSTWNGSSCAANGPSSISVSLSPDSASMTLPTNSTNLNWATSGSPTSCVASGDWSGSKATTSGVQLMSGLTARTYNYTITCSKSGVADATASTSVLVAPASGGGVTPSLTSSGTSVYSGDPLTLSWTCPVGTTSVGSPNPPFNTAGAASGSITINPAVTATYSVTCNGVVSNTITVTVKRRPIIIEN